MNLDDYLIDMSALDLNALFEAWGWLLQEDTEVAPWLMNRFGDMFWIDEKGGVNLLNVTEGTTELIAENEDKFLELLVEEENYALWLLTDFSDELVEYGLELKPNMCYAFKELPVLGGEFEPDNMYLSDIGEYWDYCGHLHAQIHDLPDGAEINIE